MKTSTRLLMLAQEASHARSVAEGIFNGRASRAAKKLRESAIAAERELWAAYAWAVYAELPEAYTLRPVVR